MSDSIDVGASLTQTSTHRSVRPAGLPVDRRPKVTAASGGAATLERRLRPSSWSAATQLAVEFGRDPEFVLLAAFAALLARLTGEGVVHLDVVHPDGTASSVECDLSAQRTFRELLASVADSLGGDPRSEAGAALNEVAFGWGSPDDWVNRQRPALDLLAVDCRTEADAMLVRLSFDPQRWIGERGRTVLDQLVSLFDQLVAAPETDFAVHSLINDRARSVLPNAATPIKPREHLLVTDAVLAAAATAPDAPAVRQHGREWTYRQLVAAGRKIAGELVSRGVSTGDSVAVVGGNSFGLVAAMLGVWWAGGVMVPIDPRLPEHRRNVMVTTAGARFSCLLVDSGVEGFKVDAPQAIAATASTVAIDARTAKLARPPAQPAPPALPQVSSADLAYIIFTSGSTGTPKGVLGYHGGLAHFLDWQRKAFGIGPGDRGGQLTAVGFDVVLRSIFLPLTSGATVILPDSDAMDVESVLPWLVSEKVTYTHLVPSLAAAWLADGNTRRLPDLRLVFFAGEPLDDGLVADWRRGISRGATVVNLYGPTETTLAKCYYVLPAEPRPGTAPVGHGMPGAQALVISNGRPCGIGEVGEIVIRTPYRSRGYLRDTGLDVSCFTVNPATGDEADLLYPTGDLGRYLPDGDLEILGRRDAQVKLRGVRIELGEIETILRRVPDVTAAAVALKQDGQGEAMLVAYVVARAGEPLSTSVVADALAAELPRAMRPSAVMQLAALPRTASGKVDRRALPEPTALISGALTEAQTDTQAAVMGVWQEVLGLPKISIDSEFFSLGGHSLRAASVAARIRRDLGVAVTVADIFDNATIEKLAVLIDTRAATGFVPAARRSDDPLVPTQTTGRGILSSAQQRMWFLQQLDPSSPAYNVARAFELTGAVDPELIRAGLTALVGRHEVLRTAIVVDESGNPTGVLLPPNPPDLLRVVDLGSGDPRTDSAHQDQQAQDLRDAEVRRPFDLATDYPIRALLILHDDRAQLVIVVHHVATDGWSSALLINDMSEITSALANGDTAASNRDALTYADFADWEQKQLSGDHADEQLAGDLDFWVKELAGITRLALPFDYPTSDSESGVAGATLRMALPADLNQQLQQAAQQGSTAFSVTLAAFVAVLGRHCEAVDVAVGTPSLGRPDPGLDQVVGFFSNTLVLRNNIADDPTFSELVDRVQATTLRALEHEDLPFERLVEKLAPSRGDGHAPLFDVLFNCGESDPELRIPGVRARPLSTDTGAAHFDLMLTLALGDGQASLELEYASQRFDRATISRIGEHFINSLRGGLTDPATRISALPMADDAELEGLLDWGRGSAVAYPQAALPTKILEVAAQFPNRPAVVSAGKTLTYGQLADRSAKLAGKLHQAGLTAGQEVGVCCKRGRDSVISALAVMRAGLVYTPINPAYPDDRLRSVLALANPAIILVDANQQARIEALGAKTIAIADVSPSEGHPAEARAVPLPDPWIDPIVNLDDVAYLIFTSGSTGEPKGVAQTHRTLANLLHWQAGEIAPKPGRRVALFSSFGFDVSMQEMGFALMSGSELHVTPEDARSDPQAFWEFVEKHRIELIFMPTAALDAIADVEVLADPSRGSSLEAIVVAGEELRITPRIRAMFELLPECRLINQYGPSETHVITSLELAGDASSWPAVPTIGSPIDNTSAYLLDDRGELVPRGVVGELFIGGDALAKGYLHRPELTDQRFAEHYVTVAGSRIGLGRLYRTGDLVRLANDGVLRFRGRADGQVKLRGHRVELGEIEVRLAAMDGVEQAVVVLHKAGEDHFLAAFVVATADASTQDKAEVDVAALQSGLGSQLPGYMVPEAFVLVDQIPLNANGKVAVDQLPHAQRSRSASTTEYSPPRTEEEKILAGLFQEVLHVPKVGIDDDFFELGGHSLRAAAFTALARKALRRSLTLRELFANPTVRGLASSLAREGDPLASDSELALVHDYGDAPAPLSSPQERVWLVEQLGVDPRSYVVPVAARLFGAVDSDLLRQAFDALAIRQDVLRTTVEQHDGVPMQVVGDQMPTLEFVDVSDAIDPEAEVAATIRDGLAVPFNSGSGPLIRAWLVRISDNEHVLAIALHHLVADGTSIGVLARELAELYSALRAHRRPALPALRLNYRDWSRWQRQQQGSAVVREQLKFWRAELADAPAETDLPFDRPRPTQPSYLGGDVPLDLPPEVLTALEELAKEQRCSLFSVLCAAFAALVARSGGQETVVLGIPVDARFPELADLMGFFVRTVALRVDLSGDPTFDELVARTWNNQRHALANQDAPFDDVVREVSPGRATNRNPIFQTMVVLQEVAEEGRIALEDVEVQRYPLHTEFSSFDITWFARRASGTLTTSIKYATDLFDHETIVLFADRLSRLLRSAAADPNQPVSMLDLFDERELATVTVDWNATDRDYDNEGCLHQLFEEQVDRTPTAIAAREGEREVTYRVLDSLSNGLAQRLIAMGVGPEQRVAICLDRSIEALVAVFGVLKAGAAYVPLDPSHPRERTGHVMADCAAAALITRADIAASLATAVPTLAIDELWEDLSAQPWTRPDCAAQSRNSAYVIYTSGSTGLPKGVEIEHRSARNYVNWCTDDYRVQSGQGAPWLSSLAFDLTVTSIFPILSAGGTVSIVEVGSELDARVLAAVRDASLVKLTPAHLAIVAESLSAEDAPSWSHDVIIGGEALEAQTLQLWKAHAPATRLINEYGPTEATVGCIVYDAATDSRTTGSMPIGRPIANMRAYVLDAARNPVGIGVAGELWIGGVGVARGYLGRPELTAAKFVPDPFAADPAARMYRSGDLARWHRDGILEYLGRADEQVKLRGYRIELGDIEAKLRGCPGVTDAVVALRGKGPNAFLAGYVVADAVEVDAAGDPPQLDLLAIRAQLATELPEYMVPTTVDELAAVPLSPAGKVDRRKLPEPAREVDAQTFAPPRTATELALALIWEKLLATSPIGIHQDFFVLGGHSLLVARLVGAIDRELAVQLPAQAIFTSPTIAELSLLIEAAGPRQPLDVLVPLRIGGAKPAFFCIHPAGGHVFGFMALAGHGDQQRSFIALQNPNLDPQAPLIDNVAELASRYLDEIRAEQPAGPYYLGGWSFGGVVAFEVASRLREAGEEVAVLCLFDSYLPSTGKIRQLMNTDELLDSARRSEQVVGRDGSSDTAAMERTYLSAMDMLFRYDAQPYSGPVVIFQAAESDALYDVRAEDTWHGVITPAPQVCEVPGDHHSMMREPGVAVLAEQLDRVLDSA